MKALVIWSSRTGNTKAVGKAVYDSLDCEKEFVEAGRQPEDLSAYDIIFVGFWAYRRGADVPARKVLSSLRGKKVAVYGTEKQPCRKSPSHDTGTARPSSGSRKTSG